MTSDTSSRRERLRAATLREIKEAARAHLIAEGREGMTLRAVARDMGMTAPALYRYVENVEDLRRILIADFYGELTAALERARDTVSADDIVGRLLAMVRAFRRWALGHPAEFALTFTAPAPSYEASRRRGPDAAAYEADRRFGAVFFELIVQLWYEQPFPVPSADELPAELRDQLGDYAAFLHSELPVGVLQVCVSCWVRLYGLVCLEVFGQLQFVADSEPLFEQELEDMLGRLGLGAAYRAPQRAS